MPMMAVLTTWVVDTGPPMADAARITPADVIWASRAWMGRTL